MYQFLATFFNNDTEEDVSRLIAIDLTPVENIISKAWKAAIDVALTLCEPNEEFEKIELIAEF